MYLSNAQIIGVYLLGLVTLPMIAVMVSTIQYGRRNPNQRRYIYAAAVGLALIAVVLYFAAVGLVSVVRG